MAKAARTTRYVVLRFDGSEDGGPERYSKIGETDATSSTSALRQVISGGEAKPAGGDYVATPKRSFQIMPVSVKVVEPQLIIGGEPKPELPSPPKQQQPESPSKAIAEAAREMRQELRPETADELS